MIALPKNGSAWAENVQLGVRSGQVEGPGPAAGPASAAPAPDEAVLVCAARAASNEIRPGAL